MEKDHKKVSEQIMIDDYIQYKLFVSPFIGLFD